MSDAAFKIGDPVFVWLAGWAGRTSLRGTVLKVNPKRSRVRVTESVNRRPAGDWLVPNRAITVRKERE